MYFILQQLNDKDFIQSPLLMGAVIVVRRQMATPSGSQENKRALRVYN